MADNTFTEWQEKERIYRKDHPVRWTFREVWYFVLRTKDFPTTVKWLFQRIVRGYSDCDLWNLCHFVVQKLHRPIKEFVSYQAEKGHGVPMGFEKDPAAWLEVLRKIEYAFDELYKEEFGGFFYDKYKVMSTEQIQERENKIQEGCELFGRWFRCMWD